MVHPRRFLRPAGLLVLLSCFIASPASAQEPAVTEELEPRVVGGPGLTTIGFSGFLDKLASSEDTFPWQATLQVDITRFLTSRIAVRGGLIGSTSPQGLDGDERRDVAAPAFSVTAAGLYYFTPRAMLSLYAGSEYRARLTDRPDPDAGTLLGVGGVQAALSSRASVFAEGGYGIQLTRGDEDELRTRLVGAMGVRIRF